MSEDLITITLISLIAFLSPLLAERLNIPAVVVELVLGMFLGVSFLNAIKHSEWLSFLALLGLIFLMFLSGLEIDITAILREKRTLPLSVAFLILSLIVSFAITQALGLSLLYAILLANVAVGIVVSTLRELKIEKTKFGQMSIITAFITDVTTMFLLSIYFLSGFIQIIFAFLIIVAFFISYHLGRLVIWHFPEFVARWFVRDPMEIGVRGSLAIMTVFVGLSYILGVEAILGAFLAGLLLSTLFRGGKKLYDKLYGIGYGFLIPIFFIKTGAEFYFRIDLNMIKFALILLAVSYIVKVLPALILRFERALTFGVLQSTKLSLTVAGVTIGVSAGILSDFEATSLITFTIISCLISPTIFRLLYR
ncbi:cation:proton antiporter [Archaeoglobus profundus]|uniref:Sodium/hydrogen exchanger n=1 Tax=Archaeoglobus profundus (strain DSM 5631 / JCM 9629 / NBRC 100127 / Av18) TaxID=572546 RepID=D2RGS1_ARCPA|nr:cation:proton antiporter [Archaeoglobus profundus]ADB57496.1 sodium/hydrogen exchanger [Archaeoglobus profundus DSM 5631]